MVAANTQRETKRAIRLEVQLGQRIDGKSFLVATELATNTILGTGYIKKNIVNISRKNSRLTPTGSGSALVEKDVGNAANIAKNAEKRKAHPWEDYSEHPRIAVYQKDKLLMSKVYVYVRSGVQGVQLLTSHEKLVENSQDFVAQGIVEVIRTKACMFKIESWSNQSKWISKKLKAAIG